MNSVRHGRVLTSLLSSLLICGCGATVVNSSGDYVSYENVQRTPLPPPVGTNITVTGGVAGPVPLPNVKVQAAATAGSGAATAVVVLDGDNAIAANVIASGTPTTFSLTFPLGNGYRIFVLENQGTANQRAYPVMAGSTNVLNFATNTVVDFGFVDTLSGAAVPQTNPVGGHGVSGGNVNLALPTVITNGGLSYDQSRLAGDWVTHEYNAGADFSGNFWARYLGTFDPAGFLTYTGYASFSESNAPSNVQLSLQGSGAMNNQAIPYYGLMAPSSSSYLFTRSAGTARTLGLAQRKGSGFSNDSLYGEYFYFGFNDANDGDWYVQHANFSVDDGIWGRYSNGWSSGWHGFRELEPLIMSAAGDGTVTANVPDVILADYHASLAPDGSFFCGTHGIEFAYNAFFVTMRRDENAVYASTDLYGSWTFQALQLGDPGPFPQDRLLQPARPRTARSRAVGRVTDNVPVTARAKVFVDEANNAWFASSTQSDGNTYLVGLAGVLSIDAQGIVTSSADDTFYAFLSTDKRMLVGTSNLNQNPTLFILQR